ncbi:hypothetical protein ACFYYB_17150 [Streptomyces sp. NPDC002886]|uniref:hypothetical protein n=1 Tax=Streptomyces sp. NPDC002886 TaxID=3364667 RepID=UPI0036B45D00
MTVTAPAPAPVAEHRAPSGSSGRISRAFALTAAEAAVSVSAAILLVLLSMRLDVNPMQRIGQVSGLAGIQLRLLVLLAATVVLYLVLTRWMPSAAVRISAAAVAGLATGVTASGSVVALRGTSWTFNAYGGDVGNLQQWAYHVMDGVPLLPEYPPGFPHLLAWVSQLFFDGNASVAVKWVMIGFLAISGPAAYLAWRMLLPPLWALGIGVTASLPLMEPYKPYSPVVLIIVIPVLAKLAQVVMESAKYGRKLSLAIGAGLGALLAALFLLYAGWFVWSAVGVIVLFAVILTGRARSGGLRGLVDAVLPLAATSVVFLALAGPYMIRLLRASGSTKDTYFYFDSASDPAYFAMQGSAFPGPLRSLGWPLPGELGGVGLFTILLVVGLGAVIALGLRQPLVLTLLACTGSAFLLRYWYASHMSAEGAVQLYPRTSLQIVYCMLALSGLAVYLGAQRITAWTRANEGRIPGRDALRAAGRRPRAAVIGVLVSLGLLFGSAGSATADAYMPRKPSENTLGTLAWTSHVTGNPNGKCSKYAPRGKCSTYTPLQRTKKN